MVASPIGGLGWGKAGLLEGVVDGGAAGLGRGGDFDADGLSQA
jgi:hypothetical protein